MPESWTLNGDIFLELFLGDLDEKITSTTKENETKNRMTQCDKPKIYSSSTSRTSLFTIIIIRALKPVTGPKLLSLYLQTVKPLWAVIGSTRSFFKTILSRNISKINKIYIRTGSPDVVLVKLICKQQSRICMWSYKQNELQVKIIM